MLDFVTPEPCEMQAFIGLRLFMVTGKTHPASFGISACQGLHTHLLIVTSITDTGYVML